MSVMRVAATRRNRPANPILARPFFNFDPLVNAQDSQLVAFPGLVEGQIQIATSSDVNSAGLLLRRSWLRGGQGQVAVLGGYRYFRFRESLAIDENLMTDGPAQLRHDDSGPGQFRGPE